MITENDCIELMKKYGKAYKEAQEGYSLHFWPDKSPYSEALFCHPSYRYHWSFIGMDNTYHPLENDFEEIKDQIIEFLIKFDPDLEQYFLNKKHQNILKQPKFLEAL